MEYELEEHLAQNVPTVGLNLKQAGEVPRTLGPAPKPNEGLKGPDEAVLSLFDEATRTGLPFQQKGDCQLEETTALCLQKFSRLLHTAKRDADSLGRSSLSSSFSNAADAEWPVSPFAYALDKGSQWKAKAAVPALVQILQVEPVPVRVQLVKMLAAHPGQETSRALVERAIYDVSLQVRHSAKALLRDRPRAEYRQELLEAFRYPWAPVAWHAAETLATVQDEKAVPSLIKLLDAPDPLQPYQAESGQMVVRELVRVNHMRNCLLCHAPSWESTNLVEAVVPIPGRRPRPVYYGSRHRSRGDVFVRADVTYLRQDFSVMHEVADARPWPDRQRFDYFVRTRKATAEEIAAAKTSPAEETNSPQREAVLSALRELTGRNLGAQSADWQRSDL